MPSSDTASSTSAVTRRLGLFAIFAVGANTIVGSGIFRLPAELAAELGPLSPLAFALCALLLVPVALSIAEGGGIFARSGGIYVYSRAAFGESIGCAVGMSTFAATALTLATAAAAVPGQLAELWPAAEAETVSRALAVTVVLALGLVNFAGVRPAAWATSALIVVKLAPLIAFCAVGIFFVDTGNLSPSTASAGGGSWGGALLMAFFALSGFETAAVPAGDATRPRKHVPVAVVLSLLSAAGIYLAIQTVAIGIVGADGLAVSERPLADAARAFLGAGGAAAMAVLGAISIVGLCAAMALAGPRLVEALAQDGFFPRSWGARHLRRDTPAVGVIITTFSAALLAAFFDFRNLVDFTSVVLLAQYLAACLAVPVLRRRPELLPGERLQVPLGPLLPLVGAGLMVWVLFNTGAVELVAGGAVLLAGALYGLVRARASGR